MSGRLAGKVALITGSSQGFGQGILATFVREGAKVLGLDLQATDGPVDGFTKEQAYHMKANVAEQVSWERAVSSFPSHSPYIAGPGADGLFCSSRHVSHALGNLPQSLFTTPDGRTQTSQVWMSPWTSSIVCST